MPKQPVSLANRRAEARRPERGVGEVLLEGVPSETLTALEGQIWSRIVATDDELRALESELHVLSTHLTAGQHEIRVFAPSSPGAGFRQVPSELEDVYFLHLSRHSRN